MDHYRSKAWQPFRELVWQLHDYRCLKCDRGRPAVILQVHHQSYERGRLPWEYPPERCETLCKGCHAKEHGIITPDADWELVGEDDLGAVEGECDWCGTALRHVFMITHHMWGTLEVGTHCCDNLTLTSEASEYAKYRKARACWMGSPVWSTEADGECRRRYNSHLICIREDGDECRVFIDGIRGKEVFPSSLLAKIHAYDRLQDPVVESYLLSKACSRTESKGALRKTLP